MGSSIDTARAAWSSQRHDETAGQRAAARAIFQSGVTTLGAIAKALEAQGVKTPSGAPKWHRAQVSRLLAGDAAPLVEPSSPRSAPPAAPTIPNTPAPAERLAKVNMAGPAPPSTNLNRSPPVTASPADPPRTAFYSVLVEITADVFLPLGKDGNVAPGWDRAEQTERVKPGRRLRMPPELADSLRRRGQAVILTG